eukprot:COSAG01_NODE_1843_length_9071_cov_527.289122_2_plen_199_part_00
MDLLLGCAAGLHSPRDAGTSSRSPVNRHSWARVAEHRVGPTGRRRHTTSGGARCCPLGTTQTFPPRRSTREPPGGSARGRCSRAGSLLRPRWAGVSPIEARAHGCCRRPAGRQRRAYDCTLVAIEGSDLLCIFYHCSRDSRTLVRDEGHTAGAAGIRASPRSRSGSLTFLSAGRAAGRARSARPPGRPSRIMLTAGYW